jgi:hypothetical protein
MISALVDGSLFAMVGLLKSGKATLGRGPIDCLEGLLPHPLNP